MAVELARGATIAGRYRLERLLGQGGMGQVWAATHTVTRRAAALKFLHGPAHLRPELRRRFLREARAASAVNHPNVVQILDFFELDDQTPVMVMDLLEGETLGQRLARERTLSVRDAAEILLPVVSAVGTAHAIGIVHRDLKPDNVFLVRTPNGGSSVRVLDFGIAKLISRDGAPETGIVTGTGAMLGTPSYMSPEQAFGEKDIDHRADVWAIGVMLYEVLSGGRPVEGDSIGQLVKRLMTDAIKPLGDIAPALPEEVSALAMRMLSRDRDGRPKDLREVHEVLGRHANSEVPAFGEAAPEAASFDSLGMGSDPTAAEGSLAGDRVVTGNEAIDPEAATRMSWRSPSATPSSVLDTAAAHSVTLGTTGRSRSLWIALGGAAAGAAAFAAFGWFRSTPETSVTGSQSSAAVGENAGPPKQAPLPAVSAAPSSEPVVAPSSTSLSAQPALSKPILARPSPKSATIPAPSAAKPKAPPRSGGIADEPPF